jgi:hypothetical protein
MPELEIVEKMRCGLVPVTDGEIVLPADREPLVLAVLNAARISFSHGL